MSDTTKYAGLTLRTTSGTATLEYNGRKFMTTAFIATPVPVEFLDYQALVDALEAVVENWTSQFERQGHLAPEWVKKARAALELAKGKS